MDSTSRNPMRDKTAIAGQWFSGCFRDAGVPAGTMAVRACLGALEDAGLSLEDVDGIACTNTAFRTQAQFGVNAISADWLVEALGLPGLKWYSNHPMDRVPGIGSVAQAALAVSAGLCDVVLVCHATWRSKHAGYGYAQELRPAGPDAFTAPYGFNVVVQQWAHIWHRYMFEYGVTREQLGTFVIQNRENYLLSDNIGVAPKIPLTMDDYLNSRLIAKPVCLLDCDWPNDNAGAVVVTTAERARDLKQTPVYISAIGSGMGPHDNFAFWHDGTISGTHYAAAGLWEKADLTPKDMDFAMLYEGFASFVFYWLEALGYCKAGEAAGYIASGALKRDGELPATPHGGSLNEGRSMGMGHVVEGVLQLQGRAGRRQLAKHRSTVVTGGGDPYSIAMVLHT